MTKEDILAELNVRGYTITPIISGDTIHVILNSTTGIEPYTLPRSYSLAYTLYEVQLDCVTDMLSWSGLRVKETLEYR